MSSIMASESKARKVETSGEDFVINSLGLSEPVLLKVHDISQKTGLPPHIQYLMTLKGDNDFISIHEWAARLCHALLIETGYFPTFDEPLDLSPKEALEMPEIVRIPHFVQQLSPRCMFSDRGIYTLKYKVILPELVDCQTQKSTEEGKGAEANVKEINAESVQTSTTSNAGERLNGSSEGEHIDHTVEETQTKLQEWTYRFSQDINVTMLIMEDRLIVTAYSPGEGLRGLTHQFTINIEEFLTVRARMIPVKLRPDQWLRKFDLNSTRFAGFFKNKFAIHFLDQIDGVLFERRGLICLPQLALLKILRMSHVKTILSMGKTCVFLYDVVRNNQLWKFLLKRDFPNEHIDTSFITSPTPGTSQETPPETSFYELYKQKYMAKHRVLHRLTSFPARLHPLPQIGRRHPSQPFPFPLNPFLRF